MSTIVSCNRFNISEKAAYKVVTVFLHRAVLFITEYQMDINVVVSLYQYLVKCLVTSTFRLMVSVQMLKRLCPEGGRCSDHEAMFLAVVGHEDDVAVGGPDEPGQFEVVLGAGGGGLHRGHLVRFNAAQLRS